MWNCSCFQNSYCHRTLILYRLMYTIIYGIVTIPGIAWRSPRKGFLSLDSQSFQNISYPEYIKYQKIHCSMENNKERQRKNVLSSIPGCFWKSRTNKINVCKHDADGITYLRLLYHIRDFQFVLDIVTLQCTWHIISTVSYNLFSFFLQTE